MRPGRLNDLVDGPISVSNILGMNDAHLPQTPRLQLLSPLNNPGIFERRKAS